MGQKGREKKSRKRPRFLAWVHGRWWGHRPEGRPRRGMIGRLAAYDVL